MLTKYAAMEKRCNDGYLSFCTSNVCLFQTKSFQLAEEGGAFGGLGDRSDHQVKEI
jgi:hypothetical protein